MTVRGSVRPLWSIVGSLRTVVSLGREVCRFVEALPLASGRASERDDPEIRALLSRADAARQANRPDDAIALYRQVLDRRRAHVAALRALRELLVDARRWSEALDTVERLRGQTPSGERGAESGWLAVILYELGREALASGRPDAAIGHFRDAIRGDRRFVPAALALGDALERGGDLREAVRVWERAAESAPSLALLARLERVYRREGRPSRMIALYRAAIERAPDDVGLAAALGRVYFELEMLDEAADQFEKVEVRVPDLPVVHAFLGAIFERRGETREAFEEYRRALRLARAFTWPHACTHCGASAPTWEDRCARCGRWNTLRPAGGR